MKPLSLEQATLADAVLRFVNRPGYQPVKPRVIAKKLGIEKDQKSDFKRVIKRLVRKGQILYGEKHLVRPAGVVSSNSKKSTSQSSAPSSPNSSSPAPSPSVSRESTFRELVGRFRRAAQGFGFVTPEGSAGDAAIEDIYIPAERKADAVDGDLVRIELLRDDRGELKKRHFGPGRKGPRGQVVEIVARRTHQFVGTYFESSGGSFVEIDGGKFERPLLIDDPGAKPVQPGEKIVVEVVRFPSPFTAGTAAVTEVLGRAGQPEVDTRMIIREFDLPEAFDDETLEEARRMADTFDESDVQDRLDLTDLTVVTIDPTDARDFDDAISVERIERDHWRLGVHIADVSHFVQPDSALDREAYERGTSVYLPDRVLPMLPELISNGLASLQPGRNRYAKTVFLELTPEGQFVAVDFHSTVIRSDRRLAYEEVDAFFEEPSEVASSWEPEVVALLERMRELATLLRQRWSDRGMLEMAMPDIKIDLDEEGRVCGAHRVEQTESHRLIETFMLTANEAVATRLSDDEIDFLRRIHPAPSPRKIFHLTRFAGELGFAVDNLENRFELQELLDRAAGRQEQQAIHFAVLRAMQRAVYDPKEEGHYALAADYYCHFTSPIRRYPDLLVHRLLDRLIRGKKTPIDQGQLTAMGEHCSDRERQADAAERELTKLKLLGWLEGRIGKEMDAVVTGVNRDGLFVQGIEIPAEGFLPVDLLPADHYRYSRRAHSLEGHRKKNSFQLGDSIRVAVGRVDLADRKAIFRMAGRLKKRERPDGALLKGKGRSKKGKLKGEKERGKKRSKKKRR